MDFRYRVTVVVDRNFGERIRDLPQEEPAWIIDTPVNKPIILGLWNSTRQQSHTLGITSFVDHFLSPEESVTSILDDVDLHHGVYSNDPPFDAIRIIGSPVTETLDSALLGHGFIRRSSEGSFIDYQRIAPDSA